MPEGKLSPSDCGQTEPVRDPQVTQELNHLGRVVEELDGLCRGPESDALSLLVERIRPIQRDQPPPTPEPTTGAGEGKEEELVIVASQIRAIRRDVQLLILYKSRLIDEIHDHRNRIEL
jgi:hypothetical protein